MKIIQKDILWFLSVRHEFDFDGKSSYINKRGENVINYSKDGVDGFTAFYSYDTKGQILPTRHPTLLKVLLRTKGGASLMIKEYAKGRADCTFSKIELLELQKRLNAPEWFIEAIEEEKRKINIKIGTSRITEVNEQYRISRDELLSKWAYQM